VSPVPIEVAPAAPSPAARLPHQHCAALWDPLPVELRDLVYEARINVGDKPAASVVGCAVLWCGAARKRAAEELKPIWVKRHHRRDQRDSRSCGAPGRIVEVGVVAGVELCALRPSEDLPGDGATSAAAGDILPPCLARPHGVRGRESKRLSRPGGMAGWRRSAWARSCRQLQQTQQLNSPTRHQRLGVACCMVGRLRRQEGQGGAWQLS
jgi:hypothetical protein